MDWYISVLKNFKDFESRAQLAEYWYFVLFSVIISVALTFVDGAIGLYDPSLGLGLLSGIYTLVVFVPGIAVAVRRLHDIGKSGWWLLIVLIPIIGLIIVIFFMVQNSAPGKNEYGSNPG